MEAGSLQLKGGIFGSLQLKAGSHSNLKASKCYRTANALQFKAETDTGHWEGALNVENLSDAHIGNIGYDLASFCGCNTVSYQLPRFVSFDLRYNL